MFRNGLQFAVNLKYNNYKICAAIGMLCIDASIRYPRVKIDIFELVNVHH